MDGLEYMAELGSFGRGRGVPRRAARRDDCLASLVDLSSIYDKMRQVPAFSAALDGLAEERRRAHGSDLMDTDVLKVGNGGGGGQGGER